MSARLHQVALSVRDLDAAVTFYSDVVGLQSIARFDPPGLAFFDLGGTRLLLERASEPNVGGSVLYLATKDIDATYARLVDAEVRFHGRPQLIHTDTDGTFGTPGSEEWMAFFEDPDGNTLALVERRHDA